MSNEIIYLVVNADRNARVVRRLPRLRNDEIAFRLRLNFPESWGQVQDGSLAIEVPDFTPTIAGLEVVETEQQPTAELAEAELMGT